LTVFDRHRWRWALLVPLILGSAPAFSGPGFIDRSRVSGDASAARIEVSFNCKAQYLRHEPQDGGDLLRIYLDPTSVCNGVSPLVANTRALLRPLNADLAHLTDLEYDLLFLHKTHQEYGIDAWNGLYFKLAVSGDGLTGELRETDLNVLQAPPEDGDLRPIDPNELYEPSDKHWPRRVLIEKLNGGAQGS